MGRLEKASRGRLAIELSARMSVVSVCSRPRQLSPEMSVISLPGIEIEFIISKTDILLIYYIPSVC